MSPYSDTFALLTLEPQPGTTPGCFIGEQPFVEIALVTQALVETLRSQSLRVKHDPKYNVYTSEMILRELVDFHRNALQALYLSNEASGGQIAPQAPALQPEAHSE